MVHKLTNKMSKTESSNENNHPKAKTTAFTSGKLTASSEPMHYKGTK